MNPREKKLLLYLTKKEGWTTSAELAEELSVSKRSIKSYIKNINLEMKNIIVTSANGYRIPDPVTAKQLLEDNDDDIPQDKKERTNYILRKLLLNDERQSIVNLADEMYVTYATLISEFPDVRNALSKYELSLKTKNDYVFIEGDFKNKKKMVSDLLYDEMKQQNSSISSIGKYFSSFDIDQIEPKIRNIIQSKDLFLDDLSMINLLLHLAITAERCNQFSNHISLSTDMGSKISESFIQIAREIAEEIYKQFHIRFSSGDIHDIAILISTRLAKADIDDYNDSLDGEVLEILDRIQERLERAFGFSISDNDFKIRFGIHIANMLTRLRENNRIRNLEVETIKHQFPVIYDVAVFVSDVIEKITGVSVTEDEIAYIALHIGVLVEEQTIKQEKVNVILLYPPYGHGRDEMLEKLRSSFEDSIIVTKVISSISELSDSDNYDLLIASTLIPSNINVKQIGVGKHLGSKDILLVAEAVERVKKEKEHAKISSRLNKLFHKDLFFYDLKIKDSTQMINFLCDALEKGGYVNEDYRPSVFKREELSSCGYDKIAIPHPLDVESPTTAIAVSIHPEGFIWGEFKVYVVLMLANNYNDSVLFKDVFEYTTYMLASNSGLKSIIQAKTYEDFIKALTDYNIYN
ncbi:MAG: transcription antiterminator [Erysipelotrichaceae bacterium]|nr:transcription antiterminator [Erysipelotrichaceae bacterium]MBQ6126347.1 transcription antiterminator [Erysipelotrichaceae bacterium]